MNAVDNMWTKLFHQTLSLVMSLLGISSDLMGGMSHQSNLQPTRRRS